MENRKAVFLDLQGTLGGEGLGDILDFKFFPSASHAIARLNGAHLFVIIVTNQDHIAKGLFSLEEFHRRMNYFCQELAASGAMVNAVYCCPHGPEDQCACRKPKPGLFLQAQGEFDLDLTQCYLVGDTGAWDMLAAHSIGSKSILVTTGLGESSLGEYRYLWSEINPDYIAQDVLDAVNWIISQEAQLNKRIPTPSE